MNLAGIIAISGKPGLYKVIAQGKNNIIVESLEDKKRVPAYSSDRISALDDISIYTLAEDKPLREIYTDIYNKEKGGETISHKEDLSKLKKYLLEVLPNFDQERVYPSDIKKLFQWYNMMHKAGALLVDEEVKEAEAITEESAAPKKEKAAPKKATATKKVTEKAAGPKASAKTSSAKKVAAPKTSSNRGK